MGIRKQRKKQLIAARTAAAAAQESKKARRRRILQAATSGGAMRQESAETLQARQAQELKEVKAKIALMKKDRKKLPKTGGKSQRKAASQAIRRLLEDTL